jgi:hypothetical protein
VSCAHGCGTWAHHWCLGIDPTSEEQWFCAECSSHSAPVLGSEIAPSAFRLSYTRSGPATRGTSGAYVESCTHMFRSGPANLWRVPTARDTRAMHNRMRAIVSHSSRSQQHQRPVPRDKPSLSTTHTYEDGSLTRQMKIHDQRRQRVANAVCAPGALL